MYATTIVQDLRCSQWWRFELWLSSQPKTPWTESLYHEANNHLEWAIYHFRHFCAWFTKIHKKF